MNVDRLAFVEIGDDAMKIRQRDRGKIEHPGAVIATLERDGRANGNHPNRRIEFEDGIGRRGDVERGRRRRVDRLGEFQRAAVDRG